MFNNAYYPYNSPQAVQTGFRVYPVANIEEANHSQINYAGDPIFFFNKTKQEIYYKRFDGETGNIEFVKYVKSSEPIEQKTDEIGKLKSEINTLKETIEKIHETLLTKKAVKDAE